MAAVGLVSLVLGWGRPHSLVSRASPLSLGARATETPLAERDSLLVMSDQVGEMHRAGFVSIVGSPNVGKSTLMNTILAENVSIATAKASTTRVRVIGIANSPTWQIVFSDTPGVVRPKYKLHEGMMGAVRCAIEDADLILLITDVLETGFRDHKMLERVMQSKVPVLLLINKVDLLASPPGELPKTSVEPEYDGEGALPPCPTALDLDSIRGWWQAVLPRARIFEVSALHGTHVAQVLEELVASLPEHPPYYDKELISDRPEKFFVAEIVRKQIFEQFEDEIPYCTEVVVETFQELENKIRSECAIHVLRQSQKGIVIGKGASKVKHITESSQRDLYKVFGKRFDLRLHVRVSKDWRTSDAKLKEFGYLR